jgi:hypothetical protein
MIIPLPAWTPDLPAHQNPGLIVCRNVISRTDKSYGPFSSLATYSSALTARCQGAFTARDDAGNISIFAGDVSKLYSLTSASTTWEDVSNGTYTAPSDGQWNFCQFGQRIIACNGVDEAQSYVMGSSTDFADLNAADAPIAKFPAIVKGFLVLGWVNGLPERIHWSALEDPTTFPTPGSAAAAAVQSDFQDLVGDGGWVQGVVGGLGTADGVVFQERAIWRMTYVGSPLVFQFDAVEGARGTPAPGSICKLGAVVAYLGEDDFYMFDGSNSLPIGANQIARTFFADLNQTYIANISSTVDPINKIFYWAYPSGDSTDGVCDRILSWNWNTKRWTLIEDAGDIEYLFRAGTFGYTMDSADGLGYTMDTSPFGPDSRFWTGGYPILAGFNSSHVLGFFSGSALEAEFETGDLDLADGKRIFVSGVRPIIDGGTITASIGYRNTQSDAVSYTTATSVQADAYCPQRVAARFVRANIAIASGGSWTHASSFEPRFRPEGLR